MVLVAIMILLNAVADTVLPLLVSRGIDSLRTARSLQTLGLLVAAILVSGVLSWTFNFVRQRNTARAVGDVVLGLRHDAFKAVLARDMSFYDENPSGKGVSRVTSATEDFPTVVTLTLNLLSQFLLVVLIVVVLFPIHVAPALLPPTTTPALVCVRPPFRRMPRQTNRPAAPP